jgi:MFS family permease
MEQRQAQKTIRTFALASFLNDMGSDMIYPVWPLFVATVLGAPMAVLGFIDGLGEAVVSISQAVSGYLSDRTRKRKIFVWLGYVFGALSRIGYALTVAWPHLIPFRILDRAGKMRGAPRDAMIADASTPQDRGRSFGLLRSMDHLGAVCGILICIWLVDNIGYRNLFLLAAVPSGVGAFMIFLVVKEGQPSGATIYKGFSLKHLDRDFRLFLLLSALFALGSFSYSFLLISAQRFGFQTAFVPLLYLIFTGFAALFSLPFGRLADKIGRKAVLFMSYLFWAGVCLIFIFYRGYGTTLIGFMLYGLHKAAMEPVQKTLVAELAPLEYRASTLGAFQMITGLCALPASFVAGLLWDKVHISAPFYLSLALIVLAIALLTGVKEKKGEGGEMASAF